MTHTQRFEWRCTSKATERPWRTFKYTSTQAYIIMHTHTNKFTCVRAYIDIYFFLSLRFLNSHHHVIPKNKHINLFIETWPLLVFFPSFVVYYSFNTPTPIYLSAPITSCHSSISPHLTHVHYLHSYFSYRFPTPFQYLFIITRPPTNTPFFTFLQFISFSLLFILSSSFIPSYSLTF